MEWHANTVIDVGRSHKDIMKTYMMKVIDVGRRHKDIMKTYVRVRYLIILEGQLSDHKSVHYLVIKKSVLYQSLFR